MLQGGSLLTASVEAISATLVIISLVSGVNLISVAKELEMKSQHPDRIQVIQIPDLSQMTDEELDAHARQVWAKAVEAMKAKDKG